MKGRKPIQPLRLAERRTEDGRPWPETPVSRRRSIAPLVDVDLPTLIPGLLPNGKIPADKLTEPLLVTCDIAKDADGTVIVLPNDSYILRVTKQGGTEPEEIDRVKFTGTVPETVELAIDAAYLADLPNGDVTLLFVQMIWLKGRGEEEGPYRGQPVFVDKQPPGGDTLGRIKFPDDFELHGINLAVLKTLPDETLFGKVSAYQYQEAGDVITFYVKNVKEDKELLAGTMTVGSSNGDTDLGYLRAVLESIDDVGDTAFYYYVTDDAGHVSGPSAFAYLQIYIKDSPDIIPAPVVVGFNDDVVNDDPAKNILNDGLVVDPEARPYMLVKIPNYEPPAQEGDIIWLHVSGALMFHTDPLTDADIRGEFVLEIPYPYELLRSSPAAPDIFSADVYFDVIRGGLPSRSDAVEVDFDLSTPGGRDPDPKPDPDPDPDLPDNPNDNLVPPTLTGNSGAENELPSSDLDFNAIGTVPWNGKDGKRALVDGDRIQAFIGKDAVGVIHEVRAIDNRAEPIPITITSAELKDHRGLGKFYYSVTRIIVRDDPADDIEVIVYSPYQEINLEDKDEYPGGGSLYEATWVEWRGKSTYTVNRSQAISDGGCPVRIRLDQTNLEVGDTITWSYIAHELVNWDDDNDGSPDTPKEETRIAETSFNITAADLVPKADNTLPKPGADRNPPSVDRAFVDVLVPTDKILPAQYGRGYFDYTITKADGKSTKADQDIVFLDVRGPTDA